MSFMVTFKVDANPVGKQRARYVKRGNFVQTYTPEKTRTYETFGQSERGCALPTTPDKHSTGVNW